MDFIVKPMKLEISKSDEIPNVLERPREYCSKLSLRSKLLWLLIVDCGIFVIIDR